MNQEVFAAVADALERGEPAALVTIVSTTGSTPQRVGAKMLVFADGRLVGTIGGGCYENDAFWKAREAITHRQALPPIRPSQALVFGLHHMTLAAPRAKYHLIAIHFFDDPVLLHLVHVFFTVTCWRDVLCSRSG